MSKKKLTAAKADKHVLYEKSVQNADYDAEFVEEMYRKARKKKPISVKEDFCGTHVFCCEWVKLNPEYIAYGVDLHKPTLKWGEKNHVAKLEPEQQSRVHTFNLNVLEVTEPRVDVVTAFNFSYFLFKKRNELLAYFKTAYKSLKKDGVFMLDCFGGSESYLEQEERRKVDGFTYVWEHAKFNPVSAEILCKIHFEFPDGTRKKNAFIYDWRLWNLAEIRELLEEAGFKESIVYWEGTDDDTGEGDGVFKKTTKGEACQSWIAYILALK